MERVSDGAARKGKPYRTNLARYLFASRAAWEENVGVFAGAVEKGGFHLVIGDEAYEVAIALREKKIRIKPTLVMLYDFIGLENMTKSPLDWLVAYKVNKGWARGYEKVTDEVVTPVFIGELENVPDRPFGFRLPNRRQAVRRRYRLVNYVLPFAPGEQGDRKKMRQQLGYGKESLLICSIGGTRIGRPLLDLCVQAFPAMRKKIPDLTMVLVCGPRVAADSVRVPPGVRVHGYVPRLYQHFAAADIAVVHGGATTTLELTALERPFVYFPLEGHAEQQNHVASRLQRHNAGIGLTLSKTTPQDLADVVVHNIGRSLEYAPIKTDGAKGVADLAVKLLDRT
jgi:hypothetical protein